ncbi:MAG: GNAT family N-acetyltransferase [Candidatus Sumerlaeaceae bacterium]|nr:GNAT family N-acetyltransferase [Candidatus Sumerlaeaceae bacterium]
MAAFHVRPIEAHEFDTWDEFVADSPQGTLFHTSAWKRIADIAFEPARLTLIGCFDDTHIVGGCVALDKDKMGQRTAVTPLVTPYVGFLLDTPPGEKMSDQVSRDAEVLATLATWLASHFPYQNLVNPPRLEDTRALQQAGYQLTPRFTYLINLKLPAEELWQRFDGNVRRQIKKAEKAGYDITDNLDPAEGYRLLNETFVRHGEDCPVPETVFLEMVENEHLRDARQIFCAHLDGRLASFIVLLKHQQTIYYQLAATDPEFLASGVSSLLIWEVIKTHACVEWNTLDFVGANIPSIARFKEGFNPKLQIHFQAEYCANPLIRIGKSVRDLLK